METIKMCGAKLTNEERETHLYYDPIEKTWTMDSSVPKHFRKAMKQSWTPIREYVYEDGTVCSMILTAPDKTISIRNINKKKLSEKQLNNLNADDDAAEIE